MSVPQIRLAIPQPPAHSFTRTKGSQRTKPAGGARFLYPTAVSRFAFLPGKLLPLFLLEEVTANAETKRELPRHRNAVAKKCDVPLSPWRRNLASNPDAVPDAGCNRKTGLAAAW